MFARLLTGQVQVCLGKSPRRHCQQQIRTLKHLQRRQIRRKNETTAGAIASRKEKRERLEEVAQKKKRPSFPESMKELKAHDVLFENNHLIAVNKRAGWLSQPDGSSAKDLPSLVKAYLKKKYRKKGNVYLGTLHRIDKLATGITVFAKTSKAAQRMSDAFQSFKVEKEYVAMLSGHYIGKGHVPENNSSYYRYWRKRREKFSSRVDEGRNKRDQPDGALDFAAIGHTLASRKAAGSLNSFVAVKIKSGRKHQIRRQFAGMGFPILGDILYGSRVELPKLPGSGDSPIYLHASSLKFPNPVKQDETIVIKAQIPSWWRALQKNIVVPDLKHGESYYDHALENVDYERELFDTLQEHNVLNKNNQIL